MMIDPASLAFDIDGVLADTMNLFLDIAREDFQICGIRYEDISCYTLENCLDLDKSIIDAIVRKIVDGDYRADLRPIDGAPDVLGRLGMTYKPLLFVTARPYFGPICDWIQNILPLDSGSIEVVATGSFGDKADVLIDKNISFFVEDRLETCFTLHDAGITPILFKQPWNRESHPFMEVSNWRQIESLIAFREGA
jgi:uncharacterized protein